MLGLVPAATKRGLFAVEQAVAVGVGIQRIGEKPATVVDVDQEHPVHGHDLALRPFHVLGVQVQVATGEVKGRAADPAVDRSQRVVFLRYQRAAAAGDADRQPVALPMQPGVVKVDRAGSTAQVAHAQAHLDRGGRRGRAGLQRQRPPGALDAHAVAPALPDDRAAASPDQPDVGGQVDGGVRLAGKGAQHPDLVRPGSQWD